MIAETWKVELHSHTLWSKDCLTSLEGLLETCQRKGIDKIAITDHNTAEGALELARRAPELIIVGEEIMTTQGELLCFFMKESIPAMLTPEETIKRLRDQGAVISVSHPYDRLRKGAWKEPDLLRIIDQVDALEVFNSRCLFAEDNEKAATLAKKHGKPGTVGSDAHIRYELGMATLRMQPFEGAGDFYEALKSAQPETRLSPAWVHLRSTQAKYTKKIGLAPRLWEGG
jgi:predicted metal-dependent phosphoesterase TrpH